MKKGFTLIELLVVIVIMGLLVSATLMTISSAKKKNIEIKKTTCQSENPNLCK